MSDRLNNEFLALPDRVRWNLERADGFLDLRLPDRAGNELDQIPDEHRRALPYYQIRMRLALEQERWTPALECASELHRQMPEEPSTWIQLAYATRRAADLPAAESILLNAIKQFPGNAMIQYNLACYECQLGRLDKAQTFLSKAVGLDRGFKRLALEDEDLEPLWEELEHD